MQRSTIAILGASAFVFLLTMPPAVSTISCHLGGGNQGVCSGASCSVKNSKSGCQFNDPDYCPTVMNTCETMNGDFVCCCDYDLCNHESYLGDASRPRPAPTPKPPHNPHPQPGSPHNQGGGGDTRRDVDIRCHDGSVKLGSDAPAVVDCRDTPKMCSKKRVNKPGSDETVTYACGGCDTVAPKTCKKTEYEEESKGDKTICCCDTEECNRAVVGVHPSSIVTTVALIFVSAVFLRDAFPMLIHH